MLATVTDESLASVAIGNSKNGFNIFDLFQFLFSNSVSKSTSVLGTLIFPFNLEINMGGWYLKKFFDLSNTNNDNMYMIFYLFKTVEKFHFGNHVLIFFRNFCN